ncbi:MAG: hypothetical protein M1818_005022 [Claussenomyces sp. TS43310]|nr:MAG: hypothetical protein M1818_005022 [Claussenomyces sp. TS43310]
MVTISTPQDAPRAITAKPEELRDSRYENVNIWHALEALHQDGFVVLKGVVDVTHIAQLNEYMCKEAEVLVSSNAKPFNQGVNSNILQGPPVLEPGLLYDDVFFNPFVIQVMNAYLGEKPIWNFMTGNNALPHTAGLRQPVHKDIIFHHPQCPFFCIANVPLVPFSPTNGSTEFWLGSHASTAGADQIAAMPGDVLANARLRVGEPTCNVRAEVVEARRKIRPPIQPLCDVGDIMIRDLRTWHAGMPNESEQYRIMLALGYQAQWYPNHTLRTKLPLSRAEFFMTHGGQPVEVRADLLPDDSDFGKLNDIFSFKPSVD